MKTIKPAACLILLAAGAGWAAWLTSGYRPDGVTAAGLGLGVGAALIAYMASDRKDAGVWLRFGHYGAGLAVCAASLWTGLVRPLQSAGSFGAAMAWIKDLDGLGLVLLAVPPPALMLLTVLWFEVAVGSVKYLDSGRHPWPKLRHRLDLALVAERDLIAPHHLAHRVFRNPQIPAIFLIGTPLTR